MRGLGSPGPGQLQRSREGCPGLPGHEYIAVYIDYWYLYRYYY